MLDVDSCYEALVARDPRFDGLFFVGVATTGIYCRPVCRARTPRRERCSFFRTPAEAEKASFRACFRCRPELAPGSAPVDAVPRLVAAALRRIDGGYLDHNSVADLASTLGVTDRHLRRAMERQLGVSPVAIAQSRRLALAKQLLADTNLTLTEIAFASGFQSVRRFNALFVLRFGRAPSSLPRRQASTAASPPRDPPVRLRLDFRPPLDFVDLLAFLRGRAIPGVEAVTDTDYRRVVHTQDGKVGFLRVWLDPARTALCAEISQVLIGHLGTLIRRVRDLFDLDARPDLVSGCLSRDAFLARRVRRRPGLRVPGTFDPFEMSVRAVLGQQISVRAATTLAGRLVTRFGRSLQGESAPGLSHVFPSAKQIAAAGVEDLSSIGLPQRRAATVRAVAQAFTSGPLGSSGSTPWASDPDEFVSRLRDIPGIGEWTTQYLTMRALHHPDAFPAGDLGVRRALGILSVTDVVIRAEAWRPWRSYAVMHLWTSPQEEAKQSRQKRRQREDSEGREAEQAEQTEQATKGGRHESGVHRDGKSHRQAPTRGP